MERIHYWLVSNRKLIVIGLLLVAFLYRGYFFSNSKYSQDELCVVSVANGLNSFGHEGLCIPSSLPDTIFSTLEFKKNKSVSKVIDSTINDNGNGLFNNLFLFGITKMFNNSHYTVYGFLLIVFACSLYFLYKISIRFLNKTQACVVLLLYSLNPYILLFDFNARGYFLSIAGSIVCTYLILKIRDKKNNLGLNIIYLLTALAAVYSHLLAIGIFIGHGIFILLTFDRTKKMRDGLLLVTLLFIPITLVAYYYFFPKALEVIACQSSEYIRRSSTPDHNQNFPIPITFKVYLISILQFLKPSFIILNANQIRYLVLMMIVPAVLFISGLRDWKRSSATQIPMEIKLLYIIIFSFLSMVTVLAISSGHNLLFQEHYSLTMVFAFSIIMAYTLARWMHKPGFLRSMALLFSLLLGINAIYSLNNLRKYYSESTRYEVDYESLAREINSIIPQPSSIKYKDKAAAQCVNLFLQSHTEIMQDTDSTITKLYHTE